MKRATAYIRVSSSEQRQGYSPDAQLRILQEYAEKNEFEIEALFDESESAKGSGRKEFAKMLKHVKKHKIKHVLVEKTDRIYRNLPDCVKVEELIKEQGVSLHLVKENEVLHRESPSHQKLIHDIKVVLAKNFIENLTEETKKGLLEKARQGFYPGKAPVGYMNIADPNDPNDPPRRIIVVDDEKASWVRELFRMYASGKCSLEDLRQWCIEHGYRLQRSSKPSKSKIEWVIKNIFYTGDFIWKGERYRGSHTPLVSHELFEQVQALLKGRGFRKSRKDFAFGQLLKCGVCGCAVGGQRAKGKYDYYKCSNYHGGCTEGYYPAQVLDEQFETLLTEIAPDQDLVEWMATSLNASLDRETEEVRRRVADLTKRLDMVKEDLNTAYRDKIRGAITIEMWEDFSTSLQKEKAEIMGNLARLQEADDRYLTSGVRVMDFCRRATDIYKSSEPSGKRELLQLILQNSTIQDGKITPTLRPPIELVRDMAHAAKANHPANADNSEKIEEWGG